MKKRAKRFLSLFLASIMLVSVLPASSVQAANDVGNAAISSIKSENDFVLAESGTVATIWVDSNEEKPVQRVANDLQSDVYRVTGQTAVISSEETMPEGPVVIVGTFDNSSKIKELVGNGKITPEEKAAIEGHWEAYLIKVVDKDTLVIAGSDNRGTIYGAYKISEEIGISPWHYFGDVPVQQKEVAYIPVGTLLTDEPDVQYRGLFINDEEKLYQWVGKNLDTAGTKTFGPEFYEKLFELILRLGGNYFWPAMHMVGFNNTPENIPVLQEYGVVFGTSHCDMLGRTNKHEWNTWCDNNGYPDYTLEDWDYTVNSELMKKYWREGVERHKDSDVQWTVGLRGNSDEPMNTENIEAYMIEGESKDDAQSVENAKTRILVQAMKDQYQILKDVLGEEEAEKAFKVFVPYKEVLPLYNNQIFKDFLASEDSFDFTTMWCNDNHGMVRNTPNEEERAREGGNALYLHISYWAPKDQSYMWMSSLPLSTMGEELSKSWETGIQKAWILNVGDLKPAEGELDYFMRCGWDVDYTSNSIDFSTEWMLRNFGNQMSMETADEIADILNTFYHHSNVRKIEQMRLDVFEQMNFNEWDKRMAMSRDLYERTQAVAETLNSQAARDAFYELVQSKINWIYFTNKMFYYADKSNLAYDQGRMASADSFSELSIQADKERQEEIEYYSQIVNGKWDGFIDPENYDIGSNFAGPPVTTQAPATSPAIVLGATEMGVVVQGEEMPITETSSLRFSRYNQDGKFVDIFNKGAGSFDWSASCNAEWVTLSAKSGTVCDEERVWITVNDYDVAAGKTATVTITSGTVTKDIQIIVENVVPGIADCYVEADGYVSMQAEHYTKKHDADNKTWKFLENVGRGFDGDMMRSFDADLGMIDENNISEGTSSYLSYDFYLTSTGIFDLEVYRLPTLNATGQVRFAVSVDDGEPIIISSTATDEGTSAEQNPQWAENLYHQIEKHIVSLSNLSAGNHTLKIWMIDNFISIDKMVIYTNGIPKSELGPDESYHSKYNSNFTTSVATLARKEEAAKQKDVTSTWGSGHFVESAGKVSIEAEYAMENILTSSSEVSKDMGAYTVTHHDMELPDGMLHNAWRFTQSDTGNGVYSPDYGVEWPTSKPNFRTHSPELGYRIDFTTPGWYYVWARMRTVDYESEGFYYSEDTEHFGGWISDYWTHDKDEKWVWVKISKGDSGRFWVEAPGSHTYNIWMREDGIYIDRIYMTTDPNEVPSDSSWSASIRSDDITMDMVFANSLQTKLDEINEYSYPIGTTVGCYSQSKYDALLEAIDLAEALKERGSVTESEANNALAAIDKAYQELLESQIVPEDGNEYLVYCDFEQVTGEKYPYGMTVFASNSNSTIEVIEETTGETTNRYLSFSTGTTAGTAQMLANYSTEGMTAEQRLVVEFKSRVVKNPDAINGWIGLNKNGDMATTMQFGGTSKIYLKASETKELNQPAVNEWHDYKFIVNVQANTYDVYIDGELSAESYPFRTTSTSLVGHRFGISNKANTTVHYDDLRVSITSVSTQSPGVVYYELDFENGQTDGLEEHSVTSGGSWEIKTEAGNSYLRLTTNSTSGANAQMKIPYNLPGIEQQQRLVVEFEARLANCSVTDAVLWSAMNGTAKPTVTFMIFDNNASKQVVVKKSGSSSQVVGNFEYGTWQKYKVVVDMWQHHYDVYIGDQLVCEKYPYREDSATENWLTGHRFGLNKTNGQMDFDNFKVSIIEVE